MSSVIEKHSIKYPDSLVKPNFFVIGSAKCGTTFLHDLLAQHEQIFMSSIKEPRHFTRVDYLQQQQWYENLFVGAGNFAVAGESSPSYSETTYFPETPQRIFTFNPRAKLIYIVREPFARLHSVYRQAISTGHQYEKKHYREKMSRDFGQAVFSYPPFIEGTKYWTHVVNYRQFFSNNAIKVILFEEFVDNPIGVVCDICEFLEVDKSFEFDLNAPKRNTGVGKAAYNPWPNRIKRAVPAAVLKSIPRALTGIAKRTARKMPVQKMPEATLTSKQEGRVREILGPEVEGIYRYMGITDDPWGFFSKNLGE